MLSVDRLLQVPKIAVCDSVTRISPSSHGDIIVTGSHGGLYSAELVAAAGHVGAVFNDASGGKENAGVAGLWLLHESGIPAVAVGHLTAIVGNGASSLHGIVTTLNASAADCGCIVGELGGVAAKKMQAVQSHRPMKRDRWKVGTQGYRGEQHYAGARVVLLDSASQLEASDGDAVLVSGSHGALLGDDPKSAVKHAVLAAVFNDAGGGPNRRGTSRLSALDLRRIPAVTVAASSARIGDARSTWADGRISAWNDCAGSLGARSDQSIQAFIEAFRFGGSNE